MQFRQPRSQGFSLFVIGKAGKGPGTGRSHDFQHPDIVGVINYNNNELENPRWPPKECPQNLSASSGLKMRLVFEIFPSFCYRRTRNQILQLLLHGNYVVAILPTGFGKYRSFAKQN